MTIQEIGKKVDKIIVSYKDFQKVSKHVGSEHISELLDKRFFFPLKTFVIELNVNKSLKITALVELDDFNPTSGRIQTDDYFLTYKHLKGEGRTKIDGKGATKQVMECTHVWIVGTLIYICETARERRQRISQMIDRKGSNNPYEYQNRACYLLNDIIEYSSSHHNRKSIQYQCECWGVRGHLRHYTDGRVVFIEPYKKGRLRDTIEPRSKVYLMSREVQE